MVSKSTTTTTTKTTTSLVRRSNSTALKHHLSIGFAATLFACPLIARLRFSNNTLLLAAPFSSAAADSSSAPNVDVKSSDASGWSPAYAAACRADYDAVKRFITSGADVNQETKKGSVLLHAVACGPTDVLKLVLDSGADILKKDIDGWTACLAAASCGNVENLRLLIDRGADFQAADRDGYTPLAIAEGFGNKEAAEFLRQKIQQTKTKS